MPKSATTNKACAACPIDRSVGDARVLVRHFAKHGGHHHTLGCCARKKNIAETRPRERGRKGGPQQGLLPYLPPLPRLVQLSSSLRRRAASRGGSAPLVRKKRQGRDGRLLARSPWYARKIPTRGPRLGFLPPRSPPLAHCRWQEAPRVRMPARSGQPRAGYTLNVRDQ